MVSRNYCFLVLLVVASTAYAQNYYYQSKPGSCPPPLPVQICRRACNTDRQCELNGKCCPTSCGGSVCSSPVTMSPVQKVKPGSCPAVPTGSWVCSNTCSADSDCRGSRKCCKNRCGALACQKPEYVDIESNDIPVAQPEETYINGALNNVNPYAVYNI